MARLLMIFILSLSLIMSSGCNLFNGKQDEPKQPGTPPKTEDKEKPQAEEPKEGEDYYIGLNAPVEGLREWVDKYKPYEGVFLKETSLRTVLISMGEKFVPGYSLKIDEVIKTEKEWQVRVTLKEEEAPPDAPSDTYIPWEVVSLPVDGKAVEVVEAGKKTDLMPLDIISIPKDKDLPLSKSFIVFTPLSGDTVTSPLTIEGKARVFEANFRIVVREGTKELASKVVMANEGAPGWGEFREELPFSKPVSEDVVVVLSYENMENGQLIPELTIPLKAKSAQ